MDRLRRVEDEFLCFDCPAEQIIQYFSLVLMLTHVVHLATVGIGRCTMLLLCPEKARWPPIWPTGMSETKRFRRAGVLQPVPPSSPQGDSREPIANKRLGRRSQSLFRVRVIDVTHAPAGDRAAPRELRADVPVVLSACR